MARLIKFQASWCGPCRHLTKTMDAMDIRIPIEHIDIDSDPSIASQYNVRSIPTLVLLDEHNTVLRTMNGSQPKDKLQEFLGEYA